MKRRAPLSSSLVAAAAMLMGVAPPAVVPHAANAPSVVQPQTQNAERAQAPTQAQNPAAQKAAIGGGRGKRRHRRRFSNRKELRRAFGWPSGRQWDRLRQILSRSARGIPTPATPAQVRAILELAQREARRAARRAR